MLARSLTIIWLLAIATFIGMWLSQNHLFALEFLLPPFMLILSFVAFRSAPPPVKRVHHLVVGVVLLATMVGSAYLILFAKEQSSVGAFLLVYFSGIGYVLFIMLLSLWAAIYKSYKRA